MMIYATQQIDGYQRDFETLQRRWPAQRTPWLTTLRERALARFRLLGFPTSKDEAWRSTNIGALARGDFSLAQAQPPHLDADRLKPFLLEGECAALLVFVNGRFYEPLSRWDGLPQGVRFLPMREALACEDQALKHYLSSGAAHQEDGLCALNTAFLEDGVLLELGAGARVDQPIQVLYLSVPSRDENTGGLVAHPRNVVLAGAGSEVVLVENHVSLGEAVFWTNVTTEIAVGPNARVTRYFKECQNQSSYHTARVRVRQERDSRFEAHHLLIGSALCRNELRVCLDGPGAEVLVNGLFMGQNRQHLDNYILIDHARPHCASRQLFKGILGDRSRGVFHGRVVVREDAQKTDAAQSNHNLLLSPEARIDTKPQLEIYADDVKCAHGATTGQLDPDAFFYLLSRGIDPKTAYDLLVYAFAHEVIERMPSAAIRRQAESFLFERFSMARMIGEPGA